MVTGHAMIFASDLDGVQVGCGAAGQNACAGTQRRYHAGHQPVAFGQARANHLPLFEEPVHEEHRASLRNLVQAGAFELRKGTLSDRDDSLGMLLDPTPFTLKEEEVPREGVRVRRVPSLLRAADGRYVRWIARRVGVGRGEGSSRLAFDGAIKPGV